MAERAEAICPVCRKVRMVVREAALKLKRHPRPCRSCSRKTVRRAMKFVTIECRICRRPFERPSGNTKTCAACRAPQAPRTCPVCGARFTGYASKTACSDSCRRRLRMNESYFGGKLFLAAGWAERTCQVCGRHVIKRGSVHHVFGHPNHESLVYLCAGCHDLVGKLKRRANVDIRTLTLLALFQRSGHGRWTVALKVEEYTEAEWESAVAMGIVIEAPRLRIEQLSL